MSLSDGCRLERYVVLRFHPLELVAFSYEGYDFSRFLLEEGRANSALDYDICCVIDLCFDYGKSADLLKLLTLLLVRRFCFFHFLGIFFCLLYI